MVIINSSNSSDIAGYFDYDDLFLSAAVYQIPRLSKSEYLLTYLMREDLIASRYYGSTDYIGSVILSAGEVVSVENKSIVKNYEVMDTLDLIAYGQLSGLLPNSRQANTLSDAAQATETKLEQESVKYVYNGTNFTKVEVGD